MNPLRFLLGIAVGAAVGYAAGRVYSPAGGEALQRQIRDRYHEIRREAEAAADDKRREMELRYSEAKRSGSVRTL